MVPEVAEAPAVEEAEAKPKRTRKKAVAEEPVASAEPAMVVAPEADALFKRSAKAAVVKDEPVPAPVVAEAAAPRTRRARPVEVAHADAAPEPTVVPTGAAVSPLGTDSSRRASAHSWRQNRQTSMPADGRSWISVAPQRGHRLMPSSRRSLRVSTVAFGTGGTGDGGGEYGGGTAAVCSVER